MSLTRDQWLEMWNNLKEIERLIKFDSDMKLIKRQRIINNQLKFIKGQIESVIGQME